MKRIPFLKRFEVPIVSHRKICTARTTKFGEPGDLVCANGDLVLKLQYVQRVPLVTVRDHFWMDEGVDSPDEFEAVWNEIHPRKRFDPEQMVWLHHFAFLAVDGAAVHESSTEQT